MKHSSTKGQTSYLIMMIALFIFLYVVLLPEGQKEEFVYNTNDPIGFEQPIYEGYIPPGGGPGGQNYLNLLNEAPGYVTPFLAEVVQRPLASVSLFNVPNQQFELLAQQINLESSYSNQDKKLFYFKVNNVQQTDNIQLVFFVIDHKGKLIIKLNGFTVFDDEITNNMVPLTLPGSLLLQSNSLEFSVKKPSFWNFGGNNFYQLKNIEIVKNELLQNTHELRQFIFSETEYKNINHLTLYYILNCQTLDENGRLVIKLNNAVVHDALTVCDAGTTSVDLPLNQIFPDRNVLEFSLDKGKYVLEQMLLEGSITQEEFPKYHFILQVTEMDAIYYGAPVTLHMRFPADGYRKAGAIYINGFPVYFDTQGTEFIADVSGLVHEGQNSLVLVPDTAFEIPALLLFLS